MKLHVFLDIDGVLNSRKDFESVQLEEEGSDDVRNAATEVGPSSGALLNACNMYALQTLLVNINAYQKVHIHIHIISSWRYSMMPNEVGQHSAPLLTWFTETFHKNISQVAYSLDCVPLSSDNGLEMGKEKGVDVKAWLDSKGLLVDKKLVDTNDLVLIIDDVRDSYSVLDFSWLGWEQHFIETSFRTGFNGFHGRDALSRVVKQIRAIKEKASVS